MNEEITDAEIASVGDQTENLINEIKRLTALVTVLEGRYNRVHQESLNFEVALQQEKNK